MTTYDDDANRFAEHIPEECEDEFCQICDDNFEEIDEDEEIDNE